MSNGLRGTVNPRSTSNLPNPEAAVARADAFARGRSRLMVLHRTGLLDAGLQDSLQRFTRLASDLTGAPISLVSLVDADRQYFSGVHGIDLEQTPLDASYCKHVIADDIQLQVEDSLGDDVFAHNGATKRLGVRAYLGSPVAAGGERLGALCVLDTEPRVWNAQERRIIEDLSLAVATDIELRLRVDAMSQIAVTDPLTGLGNRRALAALLERVFEQQRRVSVGIFDLNGFKAYNDTFGHPAGDDLLVQLSGRLRDVCGPGDEVFRMGGDEFCMIAARRGNLRLAQRAIEARGPGFEISSCLGVVDLPREASDVTSAIILADQRMYNGKGSRSASVDSSVTQVLQQALAERDEDLGGHSDHVSQLARATALELGVDRERVRSIELAGRLHDVGKMAISEAILSKPGPLDAQEWEQMKCHTLIGERILAAAPAMSEAAALVRSSHERFDGHGYPDGLTANEIPIGARIIFACDALDAMTSDRSYRRGMPPAHALAELRRCSGTQFDPGVVEAVLRVHARRPPQAAQPAQLGFGAPGGG
jgi:diguanylate cyclase (GGDEF)-like protein